MQLLVQKSDNFPIYAAKSLTNQPDRNKLSKNQNVCTIEEEGVVRDKHVS